MKILKVLKLSADYMLQTFDIANIHIYIYIDTVLDTQNETEIYNSRNQHTKQYSINKIKNTIHILAK